MLKAKANSPLPPVVVDLLKTVGFKAWRFHQYHRAVPVLKLLVDVAGDQDAAVMLALSLLALGEEIPQTLLDRVSAHEDVQLSSQTLERIKLYRQGALR